MQTNEEGKTGHLAAIKAMFSFYTILPINVEKRHMDSMDKYFWMCPIVGLFYAAVLFLVFVCVQHHTKEDLVAAIVAFTVVALLNRFLHLDGTIDLGDGLTVAGSREDHVRALKDTRVGAGGVCLGLLAVIVTIGGYESLGIAMFYAAWVIEIYAKNCTVATAAFGKPAEGMAAGSVRNTNTLDVVKSSILSFVICALVIWGLSTLDVEGYEHFNVYTLLNGVALLTSILWGALLAYLSNKNFGFVNGDVLGASNETFKAVFSIIAVILVTTVYLP